MDKVHNITITIVDDNGKTWEASTIIDWNKCK